MKMRAWLLGAAVVTTVAIGGAYLNRATILSMIAQSRLPHVEPNRDVTWATGPSAAPSGDRPPNVIFILADDLGYNDITFNGGGIANGAVPTPNIDALGKEGIFQTEHRVYARQGERCRTCGRGIIKRVMGAGRSTHFCPVCQK